jgi:hypothetical protein
MNTWLYHIWFLNNRISLTESLLAVLEVVSYKPAATGPCHGWESSHVPAGRFVLVEHLSLDSRYTSNILLSELLDSRHLELVAISRTVLDV